MKYPLETSLDYRLCALLALAVFYGVYFAKMLAQKRRGIQTRQIGRRKEKQLHAVEMLMSIATLGVVIAQLASILLQWNCMPAGARFTGLCTALLGDMLFLRLRAVHARQLARRYSGSGQDAAGDRRHLRIQPQSGVSGL